MPVAPETSARPPRRPAELRLAAPNPYRDQPAHLPGCDTEVGAAGHAGVCRCRCGRPVAEADPSCGWHDPRTVGVELLQEGIAVGPSLLADGNPTWWHFCAALSSEPRNTDGRWVAAGTPDHARSGPGVALTLEGSLLCRDCGRHGWVVGGRWVEA